MSTTSKTSNNSERQPLTLRFGQFLREARTELRKVTWPNRQELLIYTVVVIITVAVVSVFIGAVDFIFSQALLALGGIGG